MFSRNSPPTQRFLKFNYEIFGCILIKQPNNPEYTPNHEVAPSPTLSFSEATTFFSLLRTLAALFSVYLELDRYMHKYLSVSGIVPDPPHGILVQQF